jgi:hypothetical protein
MDVPKAFSAEVGTGSAWKMRQFKNLDHDPIPVFRIMV